MAAVLSLDRLSKRFGARLAVDAVSFEVQEREVFGLLGPNGSGKSTILRLVTGYLYPGSGTIRVAGIDVVRAARAARERIGYVPEDSPLYGHMRVVEYLEFMGRLRGITGGTLDRAVDAAVERLALATHSGGIGVWDLDLRVGGLVWDDAMWRLHGEAPHGQNISMSRWRRKSGSTSRCRTITPRWTMRRRATSCWT